MPSKIEIKIRWAREVARLLTQLDKKFSLEKLEQLKGQIIIGYRIGCIDYEKYNAINEQIERMKYENDEKGNC